MGYEIKLYVVETSDCQTVDNFGKRPSDGEYTNIYSNGNAYEVDGNTLILGLKPELRRKYSRLIGMIDLSKAGYSDNISTMKKTEAEYFFYKEDGNTPLIIDRYGEKLKQANLEDVIDALEKDCINSNYRRYKTALSFLKGCVNDYHNVQVLFFGY